MLEDIPTAALPRLVLPSIPVHPLIPIPCTSIGLTAPSIVPLDIIDVSTIGSPSTLTGRGRRGSLRLVLGASPFRTVISTPFRNVLVGRSGWWICRARRVGVRPRCALHESSVSNGCWTYATLPTVPVLVVGFRRTVTLRSPITNGALEVGRIMPFILIRRSVGICQNYQPNRYCESEVLTLIVICLILVRPETFVPSVLDGQSLLLRLWCIVLSFLAFFQTLLKMCGPLVALIESFGPLVLASTTFSVRVIN